MVIVQVFRKLSLAPLVVLISMPDFEFDNKLLSKAIYDDISAPLIPRLCLDIIVPCSVDNRP